MRHIGPVTLALIASLAVSGCGADGDPVQPTANIGVGVSDTGVHTGASIGMRKGPWNVSWGRYF